MYVREKDGEPVIVKRTAADELVRKKVRFDVERDDFLTGAAKEDRRIPPSRLRSRPTFVPPKSLMPPGRKNSAKKIKGSKKKSAIQALGKRVEQYDLRSSLAQASAGIISVQIARGDAD